MSKKLKDLIVECRDYEGESFEENCKINLIEENKVFKAYTVSIAPRELLFYTDKGTLSYVVDTIGSKDYLNLDHIELDK